MGKRFIRAYLEGIHQYGQGKTERNVQILAEVTGLPPELLKQACWPPVHADGHINVATFKEFADWAYEKGFLDRELSEEELWDPRFLPTSVEGALNLEEAPN